MWSKEEAHDGRPNFRSKVGNMWSKLETYGRPSGVLKSDWKAKIKYINSSSCILSWKHMYSFPKFLFLVKFSNIPISGTVSQHSCFWYSFPTFLFLVQSLNITVSGTVSQHPCFWYSFPDIPLSGSLQTSLSDTLRNFRCCP